MPSYKDIINKRIKEWDCPGLMDRTNATQYKKIPFSSPLLNYCTYGGIPRTKITMLYGAPGGGKSTTAIDLCHNGHIQFNEEYESEVLSLKEKIGKGEKSALTRLDELEDRGPKKVLYVDLEHGFDYVWAGKMNVQIGDVDVMQPPDTPAEQILQTIEDLISTSELGLVVIDSVPSLVTEAVTKKKYGEVTVASLAKLLTIFCQKIVPKLTRYDCTLVLINQQRANMENPYVDQIPGGEALKFYSSLIIRFRIGCPVDFLGNDLPMQAENPKGYKISAKITKQKTAPWDRRTGSYYLMTDSGIRVDMDYAQLAVNKYGVIRKSGAWFTICDPFTGEILMKDDNTAIKVNGMAKVYDYLQSNPDYYEKLKSFIVADIEGNGIDEGESGDDIE